MLSKKRKPDKGEMGLGWPMGLTGQPINAQSPTLIWAFETSLGWCFAPYYNT